MKKNDINMCEGPLLGNILRYTVPIILTSVLQLLFNSADLVVVGRFCGSASVAAVGATGSLTQLLVNFFVGLSVGAGVVVAQELGAGHGEEVSRAIHTAIPVAFICGIFLTAVGIAYSPTMLRWMGTPADVIGASSLYMRLYFAGMAPSMVYNFGAAILRAAGDTRGPLWYLTAAGVFNVLLNIFLVVVFDMDVAGVALATTMSQILAAALTMRALWKRSDACRFRLREVRIRRRVLGRIVRIGLPAGLQSATFCIPNVLIQSSINSFGSVVVSGCAAAASLEAFVVVCEAAFNQTAMNFIGQNIGAGKYERVKLIMRYCMAGAVIAGMVLGVGLCLLGRPLLSIYITDSDEAITYGIQRFFIVALPYLLYAPVEVFSGGMRGMGHSLAPMLTSIFCVCGFRVVWLGTVFRWIHTLTVLYLAWPVSWVLASVCSYILYRRIYSQLLRRQDRIRQKNGV